MVCVFGADFLRTTDGAQLAVDHIVSIRFCSTAIGVCGCVGVAGSGQFVPNLWVAIEDSLYIALMNIACGHLTQLKERLMRLNINDDTHFYAELIDCCECYGQCLRCDLWDDCLQSFLIQFDSLCFFFLYVQKFRWGNEQSSVAVVFRAVRDQRNGALFVGVSSDSGRVNDGWYSRTIQMKLNVCSLIVV